ncbi:ABC transporter substrate-binding protein [Ammoniphilus resinae]|nr:extracellular solute-binding protein [Ammoniphilus resinae]
MIELKGMTWKHERGIAPLVAATKEFQKLRPDVTISWDARPLEDFEDYPIEILAQKYDIMMIDHPFVGTGVEKGVLLPLDEWLPAEYLEDQKQNSVGASHHSYTWNGKQWALAADAASQVSAYRADLLEKYGVKVPTTWEEVFALIKELPEDVKVGIPLNPTHSYCSFLALCVNLTGTDFWDYSSGINVEAGVQSLEFLKKLVPLVHERSLDWNPIYMSDHMAETNEIAYVPLMFGYSNYSINGFKPHVIHYTNIPTRFGKPMGGILGGVGLAVSPFSKFKQEAVELGAFICSREYQTGTYFESGGQPGHRTAWTDPKINGKINRFYMNTLETLDHAYLRPRIIGTNSFQEKAGPVINKLLREQGDSQEAMAQINQLFRSLTKE